MTAHPLDEHAPLAVLDDHARDHARTHPESRDLITRLFDVIASLTATIRRTDQGQGDWLDDLNRENP